MHSTSNLEDGYIGSGKRLWLSIKKHGKENHVCEILEFLPDRRSLKLREKELVNENLLKDPMCMNLKFGGDGGFTNEEHQLKTSSAGGKKMTDKKRNILKNVMKNINIELNINGRRKIPDWTGRKHSNETKNKMKDSQKDKHVGEKNSQFGTIWIYNLELKQNKKIKKEDFENYPNWIRGYKKNISIL